MSELSSVWDALFAESPLVIQNNLPLNYDPILLKDALRTEGIDFYRYSFKQLSELIQDDKFSGLSQAGLNCLFKLRRELINTFAQVDHENQFSLALENAKHKIVYEAFRLQLLRHGINLDKISESNDSIAIQKPLNNLSQCLGVINECIQIIDKLKETNSKLEHLKSEHARLMDARTALENYSLRLLK